MKQIGYEVKEPVSKSRYKEVVLPAPPKCPRSAALANFALGSRNRYGSFHGTNRPIGRVARFDRVGARRWGFSQ